MKRFGFGSDIHSENVCRKRNEKLGKLDQALPTRLDGCLHGGDEVPHMEASNRPAQPHVGQLAPDLEASR